MYQSACSNNSQNCDSLELQARPSRCLFLVEGSRHIHGKPPQGWTSNKIICQFNPSLNMSVVCLYDNCGSLQPDISAPGVNILAAWIPDKLVGEKLSYYSLLSGTSMAAPHVSGTAAFLKSVHPTWSAAVMRSATTGKTLAKVLFSILPTLTTLISI